MRLFVLTSLFVIGSIVGAGSTAFAADDVTHLDIIGGDTAFIVDKQAQKAWWVKGECRAPIPIETSKSSGTPLNSAPMTSKLMSETVSLGSRQIRLQQQFRFNLATPLPSVDVYSSVRGGWSPIPVQVTTTCSVDMTCRQRTELPEC